MTCRLSERPPTWLRTRTPSPDEHTSPLSSGVDCIRKDSDRGCAYRQCCAVCRLRHEELLDAAHILPDRDPKSEPRVSSGLSLCKIHHAAFDRDILGIRSDLVVEVRREILQEEDGPMLVHGLQECHGRRLSVVPAATHLQPNRDLLQERYQRFLEAG